MSAEVERDPPSYASVLGGLEDNNDDRENFTLRVGELLYGSHMHHYIPLFKDNNIGMELFLTLNEEDLAVLGVEGRDIPKLAQLIRSIAPPRKTDEIRDSHLQAQPEPPMSMKRVLLMQCHTAKQLKHINKLLEIIELKLKKGKFGNTLLDTDYCAARALKILCLELARQADILSTESKNLNETFLKMTQPNTKKNKNSQFNTLVWLGILSSAVPAAVILWRFLRK